MVQCGDNFKSKYGDNNLCLLCYSHTDSQREMLSCPIILSNDECREDISTIKYEDIYGTLAEQVRAARVWDRVLRVRKTKLEHITQPNLQKNQT